MSLNKIQSILKPGLTFEGVNGSAKFSFLFSSLYRIELFKDGLDLILTKVREKDLNFEVKLIKGWDTNVGCYLTEQNKTFNKVMGVFTDKLKHKIILRSLSVNVLAHEMAHALEVESGLILNEDFRTAIGHDMKDRRPSNIALSGEIDRLMIEQVEPYPKHQIISELFARYFELLSISRNVKANGDFLTTDVTDFFANTTKWIKEVFNKRIKSKINLNIVNYSTKLIEEELGINPEKKFTENVDSFYKKTNEEGKKWSSNVKTNAKWQKSWNQHNQGIEQRNKETIE